MVFHSYHKPIQNLEAKAIEKQVPYYKHDQQAELVGLVQIVDLAVLVWHHNVKQQELKELKLLVLQELDKERTPIPVATGRG